MTTTNACGNGLSGTSGTGSYAGTTSPNFTTPVLGTPTSGNLANCTGYPTLVDAWVTYTPTFTGFGTPTAVEFYSCRVGNTLHLRGKFTSGTTTAAQAQVTLGYQGTNANVTSSNTVISTIECCGFGASSVNDAFSFTILISPNVGYVNFGIQGASTAGLTALNGNAFLSSGYVFSFFAMIPVDTF